MPPDPPQSSLPQPPDHRLSRIEENLAFTEHSVDHLHQQIAHLTRALHQAAARMDALERRLQLLLRDSPE